MSDSGPRFDGTRALLLDDDHCVVAKVRVVVVAGPDKGSSAAVDTGELSIGTAEGNDLVLTDETVSRHHCLIRASSDGFLVRDLGSTNRTLIDGVRIRQAFVEPGATIATGSTTLSFESSDEPSREPLGADTSWGNALGVSATMRRLFATLRRVSDTEATILLEGETGTGKGLIAEAIHDASSRSSGPFLVLDCSAIPPSLIESELFGHERGAFTGAHAAREGVFAAAKAGTVFLDEIGELPLEMQPKLLRALEERVVRPVGSTESVRLDVRIVAATNRELRREVNKGTFRADLFYRLNVVGVRLPPLRERREDIPMLVSHFHAQFVRPSEDPRPPAAMLRRFAQRDWHGNVRELRSAVERAVLMGETESPEDDGVAGSAGSESANADVRIDDDLGTHDESFRTAKEGAVARWEARYVAELLERCEGNISGAARAARMDRNHLRELLRRYGVIERPPRKS